MGGCINLAKFDYICRLFPACQRITIDDEGSDVNMDYFEFLLEMIDAINHKYKASKIQTIEIRTVSIVFTEYKQNDIGFRLASKNWSISIEHRNDIILKRNQYLKRQ